MTMGAIGQHTMVSDHIMSLPTNTGTGPLTRCDKCPGKNACVPPNGPSPCDIMFIGEAPGHDEDRQGKPFVGKTGRELNDHYLPFAGLRRDTCYVTNAIKCLPLGRGGRLDRSRSADVDMLLSCASQHLYNEIQASKASIIVPMGSFACYALDPDIDLDRQHGIPLETSWGTVFPMWHPAGGVHEPKKMLQIRTDFYRLGQYVKGKLHIPKDTITPDYAIATPEEMLDEYLSIEPKCNHYIPLGCDTETTKGRNPFCITFSFGPGHGRLIKTTDVDSLDIFQQILNLWTGPILWHNWLGIDMQACEDMGLHMPFHKVVDTMVRCFHLGNLPQGLKALAYRLCGMTMQDFDDVVTPYSIPLCLEYLNKAYHLDWPKPEEQTVRDENGQWKLYKPQGINAKIKRFFSDYEKNPEKDVFRAWDNWEDSHAQIEAVCGPWPGKDIRYVPEEKSTVYACRDADALVRLWPLLEKMRQQVRRKPQELWAV